MLFLVTHERVYASRRGRVLFRNCLLQSRIVDDLQDFAVPEHSCDCTSLVEFHNVSASRRAQFQICYTGAFLRTTNKSLQYRVATHPDDRNNDSQDSQRRHGKYNAIQGRYAFGEVLLRDLFSKEL
jgi:hypothetical protein